MGGRRYRRRQTARLHQKIDSKKDEQDRNDNLSNSGSQISPPPLQTPENLEAPTGQDQSASQGRDAAHIVNERLIAGWTKVVGIFTGALFAATLALCVVSFFQWRELHKTDETLRDTLKASKESSERQLRAYVFIEKADLTLQDRTVSVVLYGKNSGQTPAYKLTSALILTIGPAGEVFTPPANPNVDGPPLPAVVGPGGTFEPRHRMELVPENVPHFQSGRAVIYAWGQIDYRDAFDQSRYVKFRLESVKIGDRWAFRPTPEGNEAN